MPQSPPSLRFGTPDLGDARLDRRLESIVPALALAPSAPVPEALGNDAAAEAFYRLGRNERVDYQDMIEPHISAVVEPLPAGPILALHDTTPIVHATDADADDTYCLSSGSDGYSAHISFLVVEEGRRPVGIGHLEAVDRDVAPATKPADAGPDDDNPNPYGRSHESQRWERGIQAVAQRTEGHPVVHVVDSEGDAYAIFVALEKTGQDFVVRSGQPARITEDADGVRAALRDALPVQPVVAEREGTISARLKPRKTAPGKGKRNTEVRQGRTAHLHVAAARRILLSPRDSRTAGPESLALNLVHVWEPAPPGGAEPVDWLLWTSLPIDTAAEVLRVVDVYVARWLIEELNSSLKTGCSFSSRRFESRATSSRALAIYLPLAVQTLVLRGAAREDSDEPATLYLHEDEIAVLGALVPSLPAEPTIAQTAMAVAKLGGHLKSNGMPGWRVIGRGVEKLHYAVQGARAVLGEERRAWC